MRVMPRILVLALTSALTVPLGASPAQTATPPSTGTTPAPEQAAPAPPPGTIPPEVPFIPDLERIREGVSKSSGVTWSLEHLPPPMFRVDIEEQFDRRLREWLGDPKKLQSGPVTTPYYHSEFMKMVTPQDLNALYSNAEAAQLVATGIAGGLIMKALRNTFKSVLNSGREREACEEVANTLRELNGERAKAGLPPVTVPTC